jgi:glycerophosphoryl diester phosphodiesterase
VAGRSSRRVRFAAGERVRLRLQQRLQLRAEELGLDGIDLHADPVVITPELAARVHAAGKALATWVGRAPAQNDVSAVWAHLRRAGVDVVTTNRPAEAVAWARGAEPA